MTLQDRSRVMAERGDAVRIVNGGVCLGKWLKPGDQGIVQGHVFSVAGQRLYLTLFGKELYSLAPAEFQKVTRMEAHES